MPTIANAYVQVIPSMEGATTNITNAMLPQLEGAGAQAGTAFGAGFGGKLGAAMSKFVMPAAIVAGAVGIGKALFDIGEEFDDMTDKIVIGTGAQGEALDSLVASAKTIATTVPTDFATAGDVVQNLNTRLGITGQELEDLGTRVIEAGNLLDENLNLDTLTGSFNAFGVANEDAADALDYLFNVSQATGIGMNDLTGILEKNAPMLKELGFSFEESANLAGMLDKAGLDASSTMGKLGKVLAEAAEQGIPARDALEGILTEMEGYIEAGDDVAALELAEQIFGTKGAPQFLDAVKSGALSLEDLESAALGAGDGIMGTMEATADWDEKLQMLKNTAKVALEPLATAVFDALGQAISSLTNFIQENSGAFEALGNVVSTVAGWIGSAFEGIYSVASFIWPSVSAIVSDAGETITLIVDGFGALAGKVQSAFDAIKNAIQNPMETAKNLVKGAIEAIKGFFNFKISWPHIPLPHFGISPSGWHVSDLLQGIIPSLSINWYARGGIVDGPTLIGAGEQGPEAIVPLTAPNLQPFAAAVADAMGARGGGIYVENMTVQANDVDDFIISVNRRLVELGAI